jgi:tetratricopeptide (TPR) repeat protein
MDKLRIKFSTYQKALPPQPIRMKTEGWGGAAQKMVDGSVPQPWHCLPFVEGSTYGLELVYPYETECRVVNDGGDVRFDFDFASEPGGGLTGGEFMKFAPEAATKYYLFNARMDLQPPPGYVLRTEPHPRYFTDDAGIVPLALIGHVQSEWWPRKLFVVFRAPLPGRQHVFRKGEPYAQVLFVPHRAGYDLVRMTPEEEAARRATELAIDKTKHAIADNIWHDRDGAPFNNHYKVLATAFAGEGSAGVERVVAEGGATHAKSLPADKSIPECLAAGQRLIAEEKYREAQAVYAHVLGRSPNNADALSNMGITVACLGAPAVGLKMMARAVELEPHVPSHHNNLGELLRLLGRLPEAEAAFRASLRLRTDDPGILSVLGQTLAQQGRLAEGIEACRTAIATGTPSALAHFRFAQLLAQQQRFREARTQYEAALHLQPQLAAARRALRDLPSDKSD